MQISLGFLRDTVKKTQNPNACSRTLLCCNECEVCRVASMAVMHIGHRGRERDEAIFVPPAEVINPTGHSEVEHSRTNKTAVFLQGSMNWGRVAQFLMVFLLQMVLNLSYSFSYPYSMVYLWPCVSLMSFYRAGPLLEPQHL